MLLIKRNKLSFILISFCTTEKKKQSFVYLFWTEVLLIGPKVTFLEDDSFLLFRACSLARHTTLHCTGPQFQECTDSVCTHSWLPVSLGLSAMLPFTGTDTRDKLTFDYSHTREHTPDF